MKSERAYGASLVAGIRRAGWRPALLERVPDEDEEDPDADAVGTPAARAVLRYTDNACTR